MMDALLYWNRVALEANKVSHTTMPAPASPRVNGPTHSSRALAIVHLAMHDAYAAIIRVPLLPLYDTTVNAYVPTANIPAKSAGAAEAALVQAAHDALKALYPDQAARIAAELASFVFTGTATQQAAGRTFGAAVAVKILGDRAADPTPDGMGYTPPMTKTGHRPDPDTMGKGSTRRSTERVCSASPHRLAMRSMSRRVRAIPPTRPHSLRCAKKASSRR